MHGRRSREKAGESHTVFAYTKSAFAEEIARFVKRPLTSVRDKPHLVYLDGYLRHQGVRTVVFEFRYTDRDFLEDFAAYYVRCFQPYGRICARAHFFRSEFSRKDFHSLVAKIPSRLSDINLQDAYLGFVVIRPLPENFIGRSCLTTYEENRHRVFPCGRNFHANLFGIPLQVRGSMPFQEQDQVVAACATSALWSAFQTTGRVFQHYIPSPVEITRLAMEGQPADSRALPNRGLSSHMIAHAINKMGLDPLNVNGTDAYTLKAALSAYLKGGIPVILGIELFDQGIGEIIGKHAVTVTGFSLARKAPTRSSRARSLPNLTAERIDKIYVHDDQVGPFARMEFSGRKKLRGKPFEALTTTWKSRKKGGAVYAFPTLVMVPLYPKIRITDALIQDLALGLTKTMQAVLSDFRDLPSVNRLEWDIRLSTVNDFKESLRNASGVDAPTRLRVLSMAWPRFLWIADLIDNDEVAVSFVIDATDVESGPLVLDAIPRRGFWGFFVTDVVPVLGETAGVSGTRETRLFEFLRVNKQKRAAHHDAVRAV